MIDITFDTLIHQTTNYYYIINIITIINQTTRRLRDRIGKKELIRSRQLR